MELAFRDLGRADEDLVIDFLSLLYPAVPEVVLRERFGPVAASGWRCVAALADGVPVALTGYWVQTRFWCGRYLYIDHFVTRERERSRGVGAALLDHVGQRARDLGCEIVCLDTFVANEGAQKFWRRAGFSNVGLHFVRNVDADAPAPAPRETVRTPVPQQPEPARTLSGQRV